MAQWISVKDRLPVESGRYLVCKGRPGLTKIDVVWFATNMIDQLPDDFYEKEYDRPGWYDLDLEYGFYDISKCDIIAWMPLPDVYLE